jgi:hypothetical protein
MVTDNYLVIALPIFNVGARCGLVVNATPRSPNSQYIGPVPIVQVAE